MADTHVAKLAFLFPCAWSSCFGCSFLGIQPAWVLPGCIVDHSIDQVVAEALAEKVVEDWVGDAMEEGQALDHTEGEVELLLCVAAEHVRVQIIHHYQEHDHVVR